MNPETAPGELLQRMIRKAGWHKAALLNPFQRDAAETPCWTARTPVRKRKKRAEITANPLR
jgi:hypothetical protein